MLKIREETAKSRGNLSQYHYPTKQIDFYNLKKMFPQRKEQISLVGELY